MGDRASAAPSIRAVEIGEIEVRSGSWIPALELRDVRLLDTAGRYAVHQEDRGEWLGFLDLLKKHRPKAPINGILIAASAAGRRRHQDDAVRSRGRFFLNVSPSRSSSVHSVLSAGRVGNCSLSSANVASGWAATSAWSRASCPDSTRARNFVCFRGASEPVSRSC